MFTKIQQICPVAEGSNVQFNPQETLASVMCAMNPPGGDYFNVKSSIPECIWPNNYFCRVDAPPKCMTGLYTDVCLRPCGAELCCIRHYRYCKGPWTELYNAYEYADCIYGDNCLPDDCICAESCVGLNPLSCPTCS